MIYFTSACIATVRLHNSHGFVILLNVGGHPQPSSPPEKDKGEEVLTSLFFGGTNMDAHLAEKLSQSLAILSSTKLLLINTKATYFNNHGS